MTVILHVQPVAERGGSDQLLLRMIRALPSTEFESHVVVPGPSPLAAEFQAAGARLHVVPMRRLTLSAAPGYRIAYAARWPLVVVRLALRRPTCASRRRPHQLVALALRLGGGAARPPAARLARARDRRAVRGRAAARALPRPRFADVVVAASSAIAAQLRPEQRARA